MEQLFDDLEDFGSFDDADIRGCAGSATRS